MIDCVRCLVMAVHFNSVGNDEAVLIKQAVVAIRRWSKNVSRLTFQSVSGDNGGVDNVRIDKRCSISLRTRSTQLMPLSVD